VNSRFFPIRPVEKVVDNVENSFPARWRNPDNFTFMSTIGYGQFTKILRAANGRPYRFYRPSRRGGDPPPVNNLPIPQRFDAKKSVPFRY